LLPEVMRPRCAVPKIPTKSSVPRRLPFYNNLIFLTRSESALVEVLIPLHFNSPRISVYKKLGEGLPPSRTKGLQLVTAHESLCWSRRTAITPIPSCACAHFPSPMGCTPQPSACYGSDQAVRPKLFPRFPQPNVCAHAGNAATRFLSCVYLITRGHPGWGDSLAPRSLSSLLFSARPPRTLRLCIIFAF
jgi:hypothetical protein